MIGDHPSTTEELEYRSNGGVGVSLLWERALNRLTVRVVDEHGGAFEVPVGNARPLDVFHHPFAYAAFHGIAPQVAG